MADMTQRRRNSAPWIGLLLAVAALFSNALYFAAGPATKLISPLSMVLAVGALVCAGMGIMRTVQRPQVYPGKILAWGLGVASLLICGFVGFIFVHSRDLPVAAAAPQVGQKVPDFTLADTNNKQISLRQLLGSGATNASVTSAAPPKAVLLVFYRGYW